MKIYRIVLTGGPCAGKTEVFDYIKKELEKDNYYIISIPETARENILNGIIPYNDREHTLKFQDYMLQYQSLKEDIAYDYALNIKDKQYDFIKDKKGIIILYDRSRMDNRAYLPLKDFEDLLNKYNYKELDIIGKYDLVIDLVSTATLKQDAYVTDEARKESKEQSIQLDKVTTNAYLLYQNLKVVKPTNDIQQKKELVLELVYNLINNNQSKEIIRTSLNNNINLTEENSKEINQTKIYLNSDDIYQYIIYINKYKGDISFIFRKEFAIENKIYYKDSEQITKEEYEYLINHCSILKEENYNIKKIIENGHQYNIVSTNNEQYIEYEKINKETNKVKKLIK